MSKRSLTPKPIGFSVTSAGDISGLVGKYMRTETAVVYEMNGSTEWYADWAKKNPTEFFTKMLKGIMTREVELSASEGIEEMFRRLDGGKTIEGLASAIDDEDDDE